MKLPFLWQMVRYFSQIFLQQEFLQGCLVKEEKKHTVYASPDMYFSKTSFGGKSSGLFLTFNAT
jgi:hypothetical protein